MPSVEENSFRTQFLQLSHDLKNNLVAIRASAGNIKQSIHSSDSMSKQNIIDKSLAAIDKKINDSLTHLNMVTLISSLETNWPDDSTHLSMLDCIEQAIQNYPFISDKYASHIHFIRPITDFTFSGNQPLINCVLYCLIKNGLYSVGRERSTEATIELEQTKNQNQLHFTFLESSNNNDKLYALGTPTKHGDGLHYIRKVMYKMNGAINFSAKSNGQLTLSLLFQNISDT